MASALLTEGHSRETLQSGGLVGSLVTTHRTGLSKAEKMTGKTNSRGRKDHRSGPYCEFGPMDNSLMDFQLGSVHRAGERV